MPKLVPDKVLDEVSHQIAWAKTSRVPFEKEWEQGINYMMGNHFGEAPVALDSPVVVNKFWPLVQASLPALFFQVPYVFAEAKEKWFQGTTPAGEPVILDNEANARNVEAVTNNAWRSSKLKREVRKVIVDCFTQSVGWMKVGYSSEFGVPAEATIQANIDPAVLQSLQQSFPGLTDEDYLRLDGKGNLLEIDTNIRPGYAWGKMVPNSHMWVDPAGTEPEDMRFMFSKHYRDIRNLQRDPMFSNTKDLKPDSSFERDDAGQDSGVWPRIQGLRTNMSRSPDVGGVSDDPVDGVWVYEFWDKYRRDVYWLVKQPSTQGSAQYRIIRRAGGWPYEEIAGFPYYPLRLNTVNHRFYPLTMIQQWIPQQRELNLIRTIKLDHIRRQGRKILAEKGAMHADEAARLQNPSAYSVIEVNPGRIDAIKALDPGTIMPDLFRGEEEIRRDIDESTGFLGSSAARGQAMSPGVSATEASGVFSSLGVQQDDMLGMVTDHCTEFTEGLFLVTRQFWTEDRMILHSNNMQGKEFVKVTRDSLAGLFSFKLEVGGTTRTSKEIRQKQAIDLLSLVMNDTFVQLMGPEPVKKVLEWVFKAFDIAYPEAMMEGAKEFVMPADRAKMEQQQQAAQMQLQARAGQQGAPGVGGQQPGPAPGAGMQPNQHGGGPVTPDVGGGGDIGNLLQSILAGRAA